MAHVLRQIVFNIKFLKQVSSGTSRGMVTPHERSGRGLAAGEGAPPPPPPTCDPVEHKVFVLTDRVH